MDNQERLFNTDELNPDIAKVADRYVVLTELLKDTKDKLEIQGQNLMGMMKKIKKTRIRHGGYTIECTHKDEVNGIKLKADKGTEKKKAKKGKKKNTDSNDTSKDA